MVPFLQSLRSSYNKRWQQRCTKQRIVGNMNTVQNKRGNLTQHKYPILNDFTYFKLLVKQSGKPYKCQDHNTIHYLFL